MKHVINIDNHCILDNKNKQLIIHKGLETIQVPIEDIISIVIDANGVAIKKEIISLCAEFGVLIYFSDSKHLPQSIIIPMHGNVLQTKTLLNQINFIPSHSGILWRDIIKSKIKNQHKLCTFYKIPSNVFFNFYDNIQENDTTNIEAQAAKIYFKLIFGDDFIRDRDMNGINLFLNYSYALIRGLVARSICSTGLNPALGIHHHNQYDPMPLASDLMEPFRPFSDHMVIKLIKNGKFEHAGLTKEVKENLIKIFTEPCTVDGKATTLEYAVRLYVSSIKKYIEDQNEIILFPELCL